MTDQTMTETQPTLAQLAEAFFQAKAEETRAAELRKQLAALIQNMTGHTSESSKTFKDGDWKVTVKQPINRSMDWEKWEEVKTRIPQELWPVETKTVLDDTGVKWLQKNDSATYAVLAEALTTKYGAVSVTVTQNTPTEKE